MNIIQFFHKKETLPPFEIGDKVRLKTDFEGIRLLYNREYPNCAMNKEDFQKAFDQSLRSRLGNEVHIVTKIEVGTIAAGGWFISVKGIESAFHGNIFELI